MGLIVNLEEQTCLTAHIDFLDFAALFERIWIVVEVFKIKNSENCISSMVVQDNW